MFELLGIPPQAFFGQLLLGLINGAFYALLSLGLAVIFGLLNVINFTHGAQYMMGAFGAWMLLNWLGVPFWVSLVIVPILVGIFGMVLERLFLKKLYHLDHLYGLLLTFGMALIIEGLYRRQFGSSGQPFENPIPGGMNLGFMFLPYYRAFIIAASLVVCLATWYVIERTKLGSYLRAATERPDLVQAMGINVPRMVTLTYGVGVGLAALGGVLAAPAYQVNPTMGANLIIVVCKTDPTQGARGTSLILVETDKPKRDAMIKEAFDVHTADVGHLPLHQQALAWGVSKQVKLVQMADNYMPFKWIAVSK
jgi:branched-chain amino acid transport system permease protein